MPENDAVWKIIIDSIARVEGKVDAGLSALSAKLESKADKADVARLETRLDGHEGRLEKVERKEVAQEATKSSQATRTERFRWSLTTVLAVVSCAALVISIFHG